jgi:hypothetical protein
MYPAAITISALWHNFSNLNSVACSWSNCTIYSHRQDFISTINKVTDGIAPIFRVLGFLLILIFSVPFLLSSSLGAGLDKRTQKPLGAHQERTSIAMKENRAVCDLQPNYVSCIGNLTSLDHFTSMHPFIIRVVSLLSFISSLLCSKI